MAMAEEKCNRGEGKRTKDEVIGVAFAKLRPQRDDVFADIGCHSCKVSGFFSDYVRIVYAVDIDTENICKDFLRNKKNIVVLRAHGLEFLKERGDEVDIVFFGGTRDIEEMIAMAAEKGVKKMCVSAARIEVAINAKRAMGKLFREIVAVNVWRSYELSGLTAFKPINPVFLVFGGI